MKFQKLTLAAAFAITITGTLSPAQADSSNANMAVFDFNYGNGRLTFNAESQLTGTGDEYVKYSDLPTIEHVFAYFYFLIPSFSTDPEIQRAAISYKFNPSNDPTFHFHDGNLVGFYDTEKSIEWYPYTTGLKPNGDPYDSTIKAWIYSTLEVKDNLLIESGTIEIFSHIDGTISKRNFSQTQPITFSTLVPINPAPLSVPESSTIAGSLLSIGLFAALKLKQL